MNNYINELLKDLHYDYSEFILKNLSIIHVASEFDESRNLFSDEICSKGFEITELLTGFIRVEEFFNAITDKILFLMPPPNDPYIFNIYKWDKGIFRITTGTLLHDPANKYRTYIDFSYLLGIKDE